MRVVQINATCGKGSTGKIAVDISRMLMDKGIENYILYSSPTSDYPLGLQCSDDKYIKLQALKSRVMGNYGFNSSKATQKIIAQLERIRPDIVHLHNIHGHDCNLRLLFKYFKKNRTKLFWTFHDCWAFTGYCTYFDMAKCDRYKTGCGNCPQKNTYSWIFDKSSSLYQKKKELFSGLDLTIITPSQWLCDLVAQSFLKDYPVKVIHNGIDLNVFKPTYGDFRERYSIEFSQKVLLGVASEWEKRKGLDVFIELAKRLGDRYKIVLVGTDDAIDSSLPESIISIHRTNNQTELAQIYTAADVFLIPTREDNFPTVNLESLACGTPVITFNTGGSAESLDSSCGCVVKCDDVDSMEMEIKRICESNTFSSQACVERANLFDKDKKFVQYIKLYEEVFD